MLSLQFRRSARDGPRLPRPARPDPWSGSARRLGRRSDQDASFRSSETTKLSKSAPNAAIANGEMIVVENVWQFMRDNWLSNRVFTSYDDIVGHRCKA